MSEKKTKLIGFRVDDKFPLKPYQVREFLLKVPDMFRAIQSNKFDSFAELNPEMVKWYDKIKEWKINVGVSEC